MNGLLGLRVISTPHALIRVDPPRPRTGDMRQMVDDLDAQGIRAAPTYKPGFLIVGDKAFCHPEISRTLAYRQRCLAGDMADELIRRAIYGE